MAKYNPRATPTESDSLLEKKTFNYTQSLEYVLEERRRKRLFLAFTLISTVCAIICALVVWRVYFYAAQQRASLPVRKAAIALDLLNHHVDKQAQQIAFGCESTLLIIRHCEKQGALAVDEEGNQHCSYLGYERASFLATLFGDLHPKSRWPTPAYLFAMSPGRSDHLNFREWETLQPLSRQAGIVTDIADQKTFPGIYFELLQSGILCGQAAVVSWNHYLIPELALELACGPDNGCPRTYADESFDEVWQIKYAFLPNLERPQDEQDKEDAFKGSSNITIINTGNDNDTALNNVQDMVDNADAATNGTNNRRCLRHQKHHAHNDPPYYPNHGWSVYGTVTYQNFDPLAYSKLQGDYPRDGTATGGRWKIGANHSPVGHDDNNM